MWSLLALLMAYGYILMVAGPKDFPEEEASSRRFPGWMIVKLSPMWPLMSKLASSTALCYFDPGGNVFIKFTPLDLILEAEDDFDKLGSNIVVLDPSVLGCINVLS